MVRRTLGVAASTALLAIFAGGGLAAGGRQGDTDPPRIVPWHVIGNIGLNMSHTRVEYTYGAPVNGNPPRETIIWKYRGRGTIGVTYDRQGNVDTLDTSSPEYRTPAGFGVGSHVPLGACHKVNGTCRYHWRGFTLVDRLNYLGGLHHSYEWDRRGIHLGGYLVSVQLFVGPDGKISEIFMARYLHCAWGETTAATCRRPPVAR